MPDTFRRRPVATLIACPTGAALIEFALVAPIFLMLLFGVAGYGAYFWRAHGFQQVANDAARAAVAGLTASERATLARSAVAAESANLAGVPSSLVTSTVTESGNIVTVAVSYDGSRDALLRVPLVPLPSTTIRRTAVVRLAGL